LPGDRELRFCCGHELVSRPRDNALHGCLFLAAVLGERRTVATSQAVLRRQLLVSVLFSGPLRGNGNVEICLAAGV
jgi:hypothetical protein